MVSKSDIIAVSSQVVLLGVTGIALFIWVAATGWQDSAGLVVSILFVVLTALQIMLSLAWWRLQRKSNAKYQPANSNDYKPKRERVGSLVVDVKLNDEEDVRHRGNGDYASTKA